MKINILELIDFEKVDTLLEGFNKTTGFVTAILDLKGTVLSKSGWRQMCTNFHRVNPKTSKKCTISDTVLAGKLAKGEKYHFYKCLNGLVDVAVPIIINGEHIANLFSGQFFFEEPDRAFFIKQAEKYGFNEEKYLQALDIVPIVSKEKVLTAMDFLLNMTLLISEMTFQKLEQTELNRTIRESEEQFSKAFSSSPIGITITNQSNGKFIEVNKSWSSIYGYTEEEAIGNTPVELSIIDTETRQQIIEEIKSKGTLKNVELSLRNKSGEYRTILFSSENIEIRGEPCVLSTGIDVTERKQAEVAVTVSEEKFKDIFESANVGKSITLPTGKINVNKAFCKMLGYTREELQNTKWQEITPGEEVPIIQKTMEPLLKGEKDSARFEKRYICKNGKQIWVDVSVSVRRDKNGKLLYFITTIIDINERKQAEKDLKESQFFFEQLFIQSSTSTQLLDSEGWCVKINPKLSELFGVRPEDIEGKKYNILHDDKIIRTGVINHLKKVFENKETVRWEVNFDIEHASETTRVDVSKPEKRWFHNIAYPIMDANGNLIYVIIQHEDITDRKLAEDDLKLSEEKFAKAFRLSPYMVTLSSMDGKVVEVNDCVFDIIGYTKDEFIGKTTTELQLWANPDVRDIFINHLQQYGSVHEMDVQFRNKSGEIRDYLLSAGIIELNEGKLVLSIVHDITERKHAELALRESEERFRKIFEEGPLGMAIASLTSGKLLSVNKALCDMLDYTKDELLKLTFKDVTYLNDLDHDVEAVKNLHEGSIQKHYTEKRYQKKNGELIWGARALTKIYSEKDQKDYALAMIEDISKRKMTEERLIDSLEYNRTLFDQSVIGLVLTTMEGKLVDVNSAFAKIIGRTIEETLTLTYWDITPENYAEQEQIQLKSLNTIGSYGPYEKEYIHKDGHLVPIRIQGLIIERNNEKFIWSNVEDITEQRTIQNELKESEKRFKDVLENVNLITVLLDIQGRITYCNSYFLELAGYSSSEVIEANWFDLFVPDISIEAKDVFLNGLESGEIDRKYENPIRIKNGEYRDISWYNTLLKSGSGEIIGTASIGEDRTEQKKIQDAIQQSQHVLSLFVKHSPASIAMLDHDMKYVVTSDRYLTDYDINKHSVVGKSHYEIFPEVPDRWKEIHKRCLAGQIEKADEDPFPRSDGTIDWIRWEIHPWYESKNKVGGIILFSEVITDRIKAKAEIKKLNEELEMKVKLRTAQLQASNKELETFTYSVSHDLKAPLRGIDGYSKLLLDLYKPSLNEEAQTFIKTIRSSTLQMNQLIDDLLNYSRLERSQLSLERIKIKDLITSVLSLYHADLEAGNFDINMNIADIELIADPKGLTIALRNLLENAIKFTKSKDEPSIQIEVEEKDLSWMISVKDNGIGFNMHYHQKIFEIFQRLQRVEDFPGTGIGLAMVNKAMQRMNGRVWAESALGMGSTFYLEILKNQ